MSGLQLQSAQTWHAALGACAPHLPTADGPCRVARFRGTPAELRQPALLDDVLCLHLGGAKRVRRERGLNKAAFEVPDGTLTLMPRAQENRWSTVGPIDFMHIVVSPKAFNEVAESEHGRTRDEIVFHDDVGFHDPLIVQLSSELARLDGSQVEGRLYREGVFTTWLLALLRSHSSIASTMMQRRSASAGGLAAWKLKKVLDYLEEHRAEDVAYEELTALAQVSRSHLFRAFKISTGVAPGRYLEQIRLNAAKDALENGRSLDAAASHGGFRNGRDMSRAFRRRFGVTPTSYRRWYL